jgi:hypothetical protein
MGFRELLGRDSVHSVVNVHEFRHSASPVTNSDCDPRESSAAQVSTVIAQAF